MQMRFSPAVSKPSGGSSLRAPISRSKSGWLSEAEIARHQRAVLVKAASSTTRPLLICRPGSKNRQVADDCVCSAAKDGRHGVTSVLLRQQMNPESGQHSLASAGHY